MSTLEHYERICGEDLDTSNYDEMELVMRLSEPELSSIADEQKAELDLWLDSINSNVKGMQQ